MTFFFIHVLAPLSVFALIAMRRRTLLPFLPSPFFLPSLILLLQLPSCCNASTLQVKMRLMHAFELL